MKKVIVSVPERGYFKVDHLKAHNIQELPDPSKARAQHRKLVNTLKEYGASVIELKELNGHPNSVFTMDTSVVLGDSFIKLRMGLPTRRGEDEWMATVLENLNLKKLGSVNAPGTAEGGDLIPAYPVFFIGLSSRTNLEGSRQVAKIVENLGYEVRKIHVPEMHLHLGGSMTLIGEDRILACRSLPKEFFKGFEVYWIDCRTFISGNVINLGDNRVIVEKRNDEVRKILINEGYEVIPLDLSEFVKGSGGPSCLILPVERG